MGFEKSDYIGGLWRYTANQDTLSVTKSTKVNLSRQKFSFTDFPWPDDSIDDYPEASLVADYIDLYAKAFDLLPHCRLGLGAHRLERSKESDHWDLTVKNKQGELITEQFRKVLITTGTQGRPVVPKVQGIDQFKGKIIHSIAFKEPKDFAGKKVVVVGLSNTGGDVCAELSDVASEIYLSHRSGALLVNRAEKGKAPPDHMATRRLAKIVSTMNKYFPRLASYLGSVGLGMKMKYGMKVKPEWNLLPAHPISNVSPVMNDHLVPLLHQGRIKSVPGISSVSSDGHTLTFSDGTTIPNVDAIIFCTGYEFDYSWLSDAANPTLHPTPEWDNHPNSNSMPYATLYRGIFSLDHPDTLAFIGAYRGHCISAFVNADLASMALTQVWKGHYRLPPRSEMDKWCADFYRSMLNLIKPWRTIQLGQNAKEFETFLNDAAGNGINENLGWGLQGWKFMLGNWRLYRTLMDGLDTPFIYRLFDSPRGEKGRKPWEPAEEWIWKLNGKEAPKKSKKHV